MGPVIEQATHFCGGLREGCVWVANSPCASNR
jgi:hypothetical protein